VDEPNISISKRRDDENKSQAMSEPLPRKHKALSAPRVKRVAFHLQQQDSEVQREEEKRSPSQVPKLEISSYEPVVSKQQFSPHLIARQASPRTSPRSPPATRSSSSQERNETIRSQRVDDLDSKIIKMSLIDAASTTPDCNFCLFYGGRQDDTLNVKAFRMVPITESMQEAHSKRTEKIGRFLPFPIPSNLEDVFLEGERVELLMYAFCLYNVDNVSSSTAPGDQPVQMRFSTPIKLFTCDEEEATDCCNVVFSKNCTDFGNVLLVKVHGKNITIPNLKWIR
jgi:hypothetical protein